MPKGVPLLFYHTYSRYRMEEKELLQQLGDRIRDIRTKKNLTQYELADKCDINRNYIGMLERGERNPTFLTLLKIAKGCGVKIKDLVR